MQNVPYPYEVNGKVLCTYLGFYGDPEIQIYWLHNVTKEKKKEITKKSHTINNFQKVSFIKRFERNCVIIV